MAYLSCGALNVILTATRPQRQPKNYSDKKVSMMNGSEELNGNPKSMRYNTTFSRLLKLFFNMSEMEKLELLKYAKSIVDERTLPRNLCLIPVTCMLEQKNHRGLILDINAYGAYIDTNIPFPIGHTTNLIFFNPFSQKNVNLDGKIIWSSDHGIGVKFSEWSRMRYIW
jgi:hypothetical protein